MKYSNLNYGYKRVQIQENNTENSQYTENHRLLLWDRYDYKINILLLVIICTMENKYAGIADREREMSLLKTATLVQQHSLRVLVVRGGAPC